MPRGAFVVNRVRSRPAFDDAPPSPEQAAEAAAVRGLRLEAGGGERLVAAHADAVRLAALDQGHMRELAGRSVPVIRLPELASDVRDLGALANIAELLMVGGV